MRFHGLDLNLLVAFDTLVDQRNVSRASLVMNLSQSAMSNALSRLRMFFDDDLFVSNGRGMVLTPKAEELAPAVRETLLHVQSAITNRASFDPAGSGREFSIISSDYVHTVLLNPLMQRVSQTAKNVRFRILPVTESTVEQFNLGKIDLAILADAVLLPNQPSRLLFEDDFTAICCAQNGDVAEVLDIHQITRLGHVATSLGMGRPGTIVDVMLKQSDIPRRIEVVVPTFSALPGTIVGTKRIAILHRRLAVYFARFLPIRLVQLPFELAPVREFAQWHKLRERDGGLEWLLRQMEDLSDVLKN